MLGMYKDRRANLAIVLGALAVLGLATWLVRSQTTVQEESYMRAMIPHHSIAILTSENSEIEDRRVCELAVEIIEAQRREIDEMTWLIEDIADNGPATSAEEAARRQVPEFAGTALRTCGLLGTSGPDRAAIPIEPRVPHFAGRSLEPWVSGWWWLLGGYSLGLAVTTESIY
jgi:hypothetical protein